MAKRLFDEFNPVSTEQWLDLIRADLKGKPLEKLSRKTPDGIELFPAIGPDALQFDANQSYSGKTQGGWKLHHVFQSGTIDQLLKILETPRHFELDSVGIVLDFGGRSGRGVRCFTSGEFRRLAEALRKLPLEVHWMAGAHTLPVAAMLHNYAAGSIDNDPADLLWMPNAVSPEEISDFTLPAKILKDANPINPSFRRLQVSMAKAHEAGATPANQIAWALSCLVDYVEGFSDQGISVKQIFQNLQFEFALGTDFYGEIAKIRAFRRLLAMVLPKYEMADFAIPIFGKGDFASLSTLDSHTNLLRATTTAMAAIIGGCDYVSTPGFDEIYLDADPRSTRMARNIQLILRDESGFAQVADPAGGSWYIENYTQQLAEIAWKQFLELEKSGGYLNAWKAGLISNQISERQSKIQAELDTRKIVRVGVNQYAGANPVLQDIPKEIEFRNLLSSKVETPKFDDLNALELQYHETVPEITEGIKQSLLQEGVIRTGSLDAALLDDYCLFGFPSLQFHTFNHNAPKPMRAGMEFERIREALSDQFSVYLFPFGDAKMRMARLGFARDIMGVFGAKTFVPDDPTDTARNWAELLQAKPDYMILCAGNEDYFSEGLDWGSQCKVALPNTRIIVAGKPDGWEKLQESGVQHFLFAGMNVRAFALQILKELGLKEA